MAALRVSAVVPTLVRVASPLTPVTLSPFPVSRPVVLKPLVWAAAV